MSFSAARIPVAKSMGFRERRFSSTKDPSESGEFFALVLLFSPPRHGCDGATEVVRGRSCRLHVAQ